MTGTHNRKLRVDGATLGSATASFALDTVVCSDKWRGMEFPANSAFSPLDPTKFFTAMGVYKQSFSLH